VSDGGDDTAALLERIVEELVRVAEELERISQKLDTATETLVELNRSQWAD
jgi:hypothetical protein